MVSSQVADPRDDDYRRADTIVATMPERRDGVPSGPIPAVMLAAGDTFRAAAIGQLATWADRIGVPIVRGLAGLQESAQNPTLRREFTNSNE